MALYIVRTVRMDVLLAVQQLSRFSSNPREEHFDALYRMIAYLRDSAEIGIKYGADATRTKPGFSQVVYYSDANFIAGERNMSASDCALCC